MDSRLMVAKMLGLDLGDIGEFNSLGRTWWLEGRSPYIAALTGLSHKARYGRVAGCMFIVVLV